MNQIKLVYYNHNYNVKPSHISKAKIPYYDLTIVLKGELIYINNGTTISLKQGDFILIRPGEVRQRLDSSITSEYISFNFMTDMDLRLIQTITTNANNAEISSILNVCDLFYNKTPDRYLEKISYILGSLLLYIQENITNLQMNPIALKIRNYILKNYAEHITLQSISEKFHFSASYCNSIFKKETKKPIVDFLIEERMQKAKEQLVHTSLSLPQIAVKVGYDDYNYFSRLFKKHTRYTPTQYRNIYSKK